MNIKKIYIFILNYFVENIFRAAGLCSHQLIRNVLLRVSTRSDLLPQIDTHQGAL